MTEGPEVKPFTYVLIPHEDDKPVAEVRFEGTSDQELRAQIRRHFRRQLLSEDQKMAMARHITAESKRTAEAQAARAAALSGGEKADTSTAPGMTEEQTAEQQQRLVEQFLDDAAFEIIPVTMPMRDTKYIGTSLYIDDSGAFKDLALNARASRIAQREIRGDAFLLSNYDDPALDEWRRVDCDLAAYEALHAHPPKTGYDPSNQLQMSQATALREAESKRISEEDVAAADKAKTDGNARFAAGDLAGAVEAYDTAVRLTEGRRDLLADEAAATALRVSALLNRSLCKLRLGRAGAAAADARTALALDGGNTKAHYRLASALIAAKEFGDAAAAVDRLEAAGGAPADVAALRQSVSEEHAKWKKQEKKTFAKMFS